MAFSRSKLNSLLANKEYSDASNYVNEQLQEVLNDPETLISCVQKCTNIITYHLYQIKSTDKKTILREINIFVSLFINSLEMFSKISVSSIPNGAEIDKILLSAYQVMSKCAESSIEIFANFAIKTYEFIELFKANKPEMTQLPNLLQYLSSVRHKLLQKNNLKETKKLFIPCMLFLQMTDDSPKALLKNFHFEWKQKITASGEHIASDLALADLSESEASLSDMMKRNIIKSEISFLRRYPKCNNIRRLLIDKLRSLKVLPDQSYCDSIIARVELLWMHHFDCQANSSNLNEWRSLLRDISGKPAKIKEIELLLPIVRIWIALTMKKDLERKLAEKDFDNSEFKLKENIPEESDKNEKNYPSIGDLISLENDQKILHELKEAYEHIHTLCLQNNVLVDSDTYITKQLILDSLDVMAELLNLLGNSKLHKKVIELLVILSEKYSCFEMKIKAICDLPSNFGSNIFADIIMKTENSNGRMTFNAIKVVMITAWRKCQDGYYSDAKEILHCLLQEELLDVSKKEFTLESNMLLSEIYLLFLYCQIAIPSYSLHFVSKNPPKSNHQNSRLESTKLGPLQLGLNVVKLTISLAQHLSGPSCSQELSRLSLAIRTSRLSLEARTLMSHINSWIGMIPEMKMFGQLTLDLSRQITFAHRFAETSLMRAEGYLLCDDTSSCRLELKEVEDILDVVKYSRSKDGRNRPLQKRVKCQNEMSTMEIVLRDCNDNSHALGASPSLLRQLFDLPEWLHHSWNDCNCQACKLDPYSLAILVFKFFTLHAAISDIDQDSDECERMLQKAVAVEEILGSKRLNINYCNSLHIQDQRKEIFSIQRLITELKGKYSKNDDCHKMLEKQSTLIANMSITFPKFPSMFAIYWEQAILKDHLHRYNSQKLEDKTEVINTPEIILRLEQMNINPSAFKTPASKKSSTCLSHLQEKTNTKLQAPVRKFFPAMLEKHEVKPIDIDEINKNFEDIENTNLEITNKSTTKLKKHLTFSTPSHLVNDGMLNSTGKEKFSVYEDLDNSTSEPKVRPMRKPTKTPKSSKSESKSSIPAPLTKAPGRVTRNRKI